MKLCLLSKLVDFIRGLIDLPERWNYFVARRAIRRLAVQDPVISFGGVLEEKKYSSALAKLQTERHEISGLIHGGAVKLLSLQKKIACHEKSFNLLYLVSSAQPRFSMDLVRQVKAQNIPFIWNQNGVGYPAWAGWQSERQNAPMRWLRQQASYIIYQSQFCREAAEKFLGPCATQSEILFNPVDLKKFFPLTERTPLKPLRLLTLGTHSYPDRVFSTLECLKILRTEGIEATLTIAGKYLWHQGEASVRQKIEQLQLVGAVRLLPSFQQEEAIQLYQSHHIVLHPKYLDPCPTVVIEALASGCPVVGSASGGLPEMVSGECGFLVPAPLSWDHMITPRGDQLAKGVMNLLPRWKEAAQAARQRAELLFDEECWIKRHREIFTTIISAVQNDLLI